jgi:hypothetical protein
MSGEQITALVFAGLLVIAVLRGRSAPPKAPQSNVEKLAGLALTLFHLCVTLPFALGALALILAALANR